MPTAGIIAEYNPFHGGHALQLERLRAALGADTGVVAVLSGDFVQRGEAACFSKFARAEAAVRCGVSLVIELPLPWCLSSAEGFARGGVGLLQATGVVDTVCFGSELASPESLRRCAERLEGEGFAPQLRHELEKGLSFAAARERAVTALYGPEAAAPLRTPNALLGVEYMRAAARLGYGADFLPIARALTAHDGEGSAAWLRRKMARGEDWLPSLPGEAAAVFAAERNAGRGPVLPESLRAALLSRLREREIPELAALPDVGEGLEHKLYAAIRDALSVEEAAQLAKSKRYALSRLRRIMLCAALGVKRDMAEGTPPYLRVLAMDDRGAELLRRMRDKARLPVIVRPAAVRRLDARCREVFELTARAHDLYVLGYENVAAQRCGGDYRAAPYIHRKENV